MSGPITLANVPQPPKNTLGTVLYGGLGNRLFQAAACYAIAKQFKKDLVVLYHAVNPHSHDNYITSIFRKLKTDQTIFPYFLWDIKYMNSIGLSTEYINDCWKICPHTPNMYSLDNTPNRYYMPTNMENNVYFVGYFQNTKFFDHERDDILKLFEPTVEISTYLKNKYTNLRNGVVLHIRLNDQTKTYKDDDAINEYYTKALNTFKEKLGENAFNNLHFYIFCNRDLSGHSIPFFKLLPSFEVVKENEINSLYLMSMCWVGCINNNSTFSWWGNYLNTNPDKIFITPEPVPHE